MANLMEGKVALVTGAGSGIGRASALRFAREGAAVVVAEIAPEAGEQTVRLIKKEGGRAMLAVCDVTRAADVEAAVRQTVETYGRLDYAHNNAGVGQSPFAPIADIPEDEWDRIIAIDLTGVFLCMKYEIRQMLRQGEGGAIVNTSSVAGIKGNRNIASYVASKHGVVGLTRAGALEYGKQGIRINAICPSLIDTPFVAWSAASQEILAATPLGRAGKPEEVAETVVWLCSERASFITGAVVCVDGGRSA